MHIHSDFLTTSSPAEGKVRSIGGKCSRWRMHASCVITFASVSMVCVPSDRFRNLFSMKLLHVVMPKIVTGSPDLDNFCANPTKKKFFAKTRFFSTKTRFFDWTYKFFGSLKLLVVDFNLI